MFWVTLWPMGSHAHLYLGELMFDWAKNCAQPYAVHLFRPEEKRIVADPHSRLPKTVMLGYGDDPFEASEEFPAVFYLTSAAVLRERLELMGYTMATVREYFASAQEDHERRGLRVSEPPAMNADSWMSGIRTVNELQRRMNLQLKAAPEGTSPLVAYMLAESELGYACPGDDVYVALRLAAEALDDDEELVYDLSDVAQGGWVDADADLIEVGIEAAIEDHARLARTIVLTEGSSDTRAIEGALRLLLPHISGYFSFMDFGELSIAGGAGELAKLVKAFAAAGIGNRTIALFDNDTASAEARRALAGLRLPKSIAVRTLPAVPFLEHYPTDGPAGPGVEDVNGRAASLELYFGADVLSPAAGGALIPVHWTSRNKQLGAWQGEVTDKRGINERFLRKLAAAALGVPPAVDDPAWREMRAVCGVLQTAFLELDTRTIIAAACEHT
jgi:hypothetical protein